MHFLRFEFVRITKPCYNKRMSESLIYILTNPSFKDYVKIGRTTDLKARVRALNNSDCLPFSFRVYATYKVDKDLDIVERAIHNLIDKIDYDLRAREEVDSRRLRTREFFALDAEQAFDVFKEIATLRGDLHNLAKAKLTKQEKDEEEAAKAIEVQSDMKRAATFSFAKKGIAPGTILEFDKDRNIKVKVLNDRQVEYNGKAYFTSNLALQLLKSMGYNWLSAQGARHFMLNGKLVADCPDID